MKVLVIDDHPLILAALKSVIQGLGSHVKITGASSAMVARETLMSGADFDLVLLDLQLGHTNGFDLLAEMRTAYPALPVVVVSASDRPSDIIRSIDMGAMGFVPKRSSNEVLFDALQQVMSGGVYVPPLSVGTYYASSSVSENPLGRSQTRALNQPIGEPITSPLLVSETANLVSLGLTPRQTDVLALLLQGQPNKLIARALGLSVETVKDHVAAVLRALGVHSRTQAVIAVSQMLQQNGDFSAWRHGQRDN